MAEMIVPQEAQDAKNDFLGETTDALKEIFASTLNSIMEQELQMQVGAGRYERTDGRRDIRNGTRPRRFDTRMGSLNLHVPRLRENSYSPSFLERYTRCEAALMAVIQEAFVCGVSTRKMEKVVEQLGVTSLSKSNVSEICRALDDAVETFRTRPLTESYPYLQFDAVYEKVRVDGRVQSQAVVVCYGVTMCGVRELLGMDIVDTESYSSWSGFFRSLLERGLKGVKLVSSDAHVGLKKAIHEIFLGAAWQRCKVHFLRNVLAPVPKHLKLAVAADLKKIYQAETRSEGSGIATEIATKYAKSCSRAMDILLDGVEDTLMYLDFPSEHFSKISSTNPIERINREIRRRTRVVGIFPNIASAIRLIGSVLLDQTEEWSTQKGYMSADSMQLIR